MSKLDNFKKFVSGHPEFIEYRKKNNVSWQSLFELYDIYGEDEGIWNKYFGNTINDKVSLDGILSALKNINLDSLEENINSIQKAVSLVGDLIRKDDIQEKEVPKNEEKINSFYGEE